MADQSVVCDLLAAQFPGMVDRHLSPVKEGIGGPERASYLLKVTQLDFLAQTLGIQQGDARNTNSCILYTVLTQAGPGATAKWRMRQDNRVGGQNASLGCPCRCYSWASPKKTGYPSADPQQTEGCRTSWQDPEQSPVLSHRDWGAVSRGSRWCDLQMQPRNSPFCPCLETFTGVPKAS